MVEEKKKEEQEEDILLKLSMPGKSLQEDTLQKAKETSSAASAEQAPQRPGTVPAESEKTAEQEETILQKLTMPGKEAASNEPQPVQEVTPPKDGGLSTAVDAEKVKRLAENIFNSDYGEKKKSR